jgi:hypothetical protein
LYQCFAGCQSQTVQNVLSIVTPKKKWKKRKNSHRQTQPDTHPKSEATRKQHKGRRHRSISNTRAETRRIFRNITARPTFNFVFDVSIQQNEHVSPLFFDEMRDRRNDCTQERASNLRAPVFVPVYDRAPVLQRVG